ncbi:MAG: MBL fold metallo-hydrolase [Candidatus Levybacteria bacterium]|nr:MBL fold metallo-hydrolase [Candidatus Levybacteria bacterium]
MKKYIVYLLLSLVFLLGIFLYQGLSVRDKNLHLVVCNVGQGDAIYIKTPSGKDVLVDGGPNDKVSDCLNKHMPFWDRDIELMVLTHPDADHITGLVNVLERYNVLHFVTSKTSKNTGIYRKFTEALKAEGLSPKYVFQNDNIDFGDGVISNILWPVSEALIKYNRASEVNELSVIQVINFGDFKALLTGDAGETVHETLIGFLNGIDVIKVPHHGSKTGMSEIFISKLNPSLAVISVGKNNRYGHPTKYILDLLTKYKIKTLRTDKNGEVEIVSDGKSYWVVN